MNSFTASVEKHAGASVNVIKIVSIVHTGLFECEGHSSQSWVKGYHAKIKHSYSENSSFKSSERVEKQNRYQAKL